MAKMRGRPPKTPSSTLSKDRSPSHHDSPGTQKLDFSQLDEEDMAEIDSLSPKQAERLLKNLDVLREKIKGKAVMEEQQKEPVISQENRRDQEEGTMQGDQQSKGLEEGSNEGNRADVEGAVMFTTQSDTLIETSTVQHGESSAGRLEAKKDKTISAAEKIGLESDNDPGQSSQWTTVMTRSKAQAQLALNPTDVMLQQDEKAVFLKLRDTQKAAYSFLKQKAKVD
ncbi:hypothetical protein RIF29_33574 [Crotalaria pallida]|uniref:Uncharacterized protein n=1 Tax=Crotalaria pallida TaxID=3830 RepID=A0AAN9EA66_CROPI